MINISDGGQTVINMYHAGGVKCIAYEDFYYVIPTYTYSVPSGIYQFSDSSVGTPPNDWIAWNSSGAAIPNPEDTGTDYCCQHRASLGTYIQDEISYRVDPTANGQGIDGVFLDDNNFLGGMQDVPDCDGATLGIHTHELNPTQTNQWCYLNNLNNAYTYAKGFSDNPIVMLNSGVDESRWANCDAQMAENMMYASGTPGLSTTWTYLSNFATSHAGAVQHGKVVVVYPNFSAQTASTAMECALYSYAYARLYDYIWTDYYTLEGLVGSSASQIYALKNGVAGTMGLITGTVTDKVSGKRITGATVQCGSNYTTTDANGCYSLHLPINNYSVTVSLSGYTQGSATVATQTVNFQLQPTVTPNVYYVATNGSDSYDGKASVWNGTHGPWLTLTHGDWQNILLPGDTVVVQAGTYNIANYTPFWLNGTSTKPITYLASGNVTIVGAAGSSVPMYLQGNYNVWDGFLITGTGTGSDGLIYIAGTGNEVKNCSFSNTGIPTNRWNSYGGVIIAGSSNFFHHNIVGPNNYGMAAVRIAAASTGGNKVYNNTLDGTCPGTYGHANYAGMLESSYSTDQFENNILDNFDYAYYSPSGTGNSTTVGYNLTYQATGLYGFSQGTGDVVSQNPQFYNPGTDYNLMYGSPAIDAGAWVGFANMGNRIDIGAYESMYSGDFPAYWSGNLIYRRFWNSIVVFNPTTSQQTSSIPAPAGMMFNVVAENGQPTAASNNTVSITVPGNSGRVLVGQ
jgi:hypothetical protein